MKRRYANAFRLIGIGLGAWTLAVAGCGLAFGFWSLAVCRMLVGIGEASFVALASPFIGEQGRRNPCEPSRLCRLWQRADTLVFVVATGWHSTQDETVQWHSWLHWCLHVVRT